MQNTDKGEHAGLNPRVEAMEVACSTFWKDTILTAVIVGIAASKHHYVDCNIDSSGGHSVLLLWGKEKRRLFLSVLRRGMLKKSRSISCANSEIWLAASDIS